MLEKNKLSYHARVERQNRMKAIEETLGFTHIVIEHKDFNRNVVNCITSSGVIIIKNLKTDKIVTAYMGTYRQIEAICRLAGKKDVPPKLQKKVKKNIEKHAELFEIRG